MTKKNVFIVCESLVERGGKHEPRARGCTAKESRINTLDLRSGTAAQGAASAVLYGAANYGFPVSTTQTITGSVLGAGAGDRFSTTRWRVAGRILIAWTTTLPAAGLLGAIAAQFCRIPGGTIALGLAVLIGLAVVVYLRRAEMFGMPSESIASVDAELHPQPVVA